MQRGKRVIPRLVAKGRAELKFRSRVCAIERGDNLARYNQRMKRLVFQRKPNSASTKPTPSL